MPAPTSDFETITPKIAEQMLENNTKNRTIKQKVIDRYAKDMKSGKWKKNGKTIVISDKNRILDGQHRLWACIEADTSFVTNVARNVDEDTFDTIDIGSNRSNHDIFGIAGISLPQNASSMASWVYKYVNDLVMARKTGTPPQLLDMFFETPSMDKFKYEGKKNTSILPIGLSCAFYWLTSQSDEAKAQEFWYAFTEEIYSTGHSPIKAVRKRITEAMLKDKRSMLPEKRFALLIKAWNAFYDGQDIRVVKFGDNEKFPQINGLNIKKCDAKNFIDKGATKTKSKVFTPKNR